MDHAPEVVPVAAAPLPSSATAEMDTVAPSAHPSQRPHSCARSGARCNTMWSPYARLNATRGVGSAPVMRGTATQLTATRILLVCDRVSIAMSRCLCTTSYNRRLRVSAWPAEPAILCNQQINASRPGSEEEKVCTHRASLRQHSLERCGGARFPTPCKIVTGNVRPEC